ALDRELAWVHDASSGQLKAVLQPRHPPPRQPQIGDGFVELEFSAAGQRLAARSSFGRGFLFDSATGQELLEETAHHILLSPDGRLVLTMTTRENEAAVLWDAATGKHLLTLKPSQPQPGGDYSAVAFSLDSRRVLVACPDHSVRIWDAGTGL